MADEQRKVDAVRLPAGFGGPGGLARLQDVLRPILGPGTKFVRQWPAGGGNFVTNDPNDSILFPSDHPRSKEERYSWVDAGNGIFYGYLKPDDAGPGPVLPVPVPPKPEGGTGA